MSFLSKNKGERVAVYIDGSNFYNYLKDEEINFPKGVKFQFKEFVDFLVNEQRECIAKRYYTGIFSNIDNTPKSIGLVLGQQKFLSKIEDDGFTIKGGKIIKHSDGTFKEKGTDVKIAVDLILGAINNLYDTAILVSSDTDLIPAVQYIKYKKKRLEYVGFSHDPSLAMQKHANLSILLLPRDIEKFKERTLL